MDTRTYLAMLTFGRPKDSAAEQLFRNRYLLSLPNAFTDDYGNIHVCTDKASRVLWSAHTDTVHRQSSDGQTVTIKNNRVELSKRSKRNGANCLGADDTTGCFLLRSMILAGVPGYYIFHYGEERGGIGSRALANNHADWLSASFDFAIALDRRGTTDIITEQAGGRTASDLFAWGLARALNMNLTPSDWGIYTDTAEYADLIPECTNISVGYSKEHTIFESQDLEYLKRLHDALLALDTSSLVAHRDPSYVEPVRDWHVDRLWRRYERDNSHVYLSQEYADVQAALTDERICPMRTDRRCTYPDCLTRIARQPNTRYCAAHRRLVRLATKRATWHKRKHVYRAEE